MNLWDRILTSLQLKINRQSFNTWLKPTQQLAFAEDTLHVEVPSLLFADWISRNYLPLIQESAREIEAHFGRLIERGTLKFRQVTLNAENVESRFAACGVPSEFDLLSVDVDGNDYWIWKAIEHFRPRVVVIEYNATFPPPVRWVMPYDPAARWTGNSNHSASLKSLELLGRAKGYSLVGCSFAGVNAFFVRNDLLGDLFEAPFTAEHHYEPPRFFLMHKAGHPRTFSESGEPTDAE